VVVSDGAADRPQPLQLSNRNPYAMNTTTQPRHAMESLLEFDTAAEAHALGLCYIRDNPGAWFRVERIPYDRYRLVVHEAPGNLTQLHHTPPIHQ
jgi:hypothetical protein